MTLQRLGLERAACDVVLDEGRSGEPGRLTKLLLRLRAGDEVLVYSVDAFQRTAGELAQLFRRLLKAGVILRIAGGEDSFVPIVKTRAARELIELLAAHEDHRQDLPVAPQARGGSRNLLSRFQIDYARKLHKQGAPLRTIGLIFQLPPNEVWALINVPRA